MHLCTHFIQFFPEFAIFLTIPRCGLIIGHHLCQSSALLYGPRLLLSVLGLGRNLFVRSESKFLRLRPLHWHWRGHSQLCGLRRPTILYFIASFPDVKSKFSGIRPRKDHMSSESSKIGFQKFYKSCLETKFFEFVRTPQLILCRINAT